MSEYVTLDGYVVIAVTPDAVGIAKSESGDPTWIPRSLCDAGDDLEKGDSDLSVVRWKADQTELDY
jgi:hypothetical protein